MTLTVTIEHANGTVEQVQPPAHIEAQLMRYMELAAQAPHLSPRERDVIAGLADGLSYKQIAYEHDISVDTVRTYVRTLYRKLGVNCVQEAVATALRTGLVH